MHPCSYDAKKEALFYPDEDCPVETSKMYYFAL